MKIIELHDANILTVKINTYCIIFSSALLQKNSCQHDGYFKLQWMTWTTVSHNSVFFNERIGNYMVILVNIICLPFPSDREESATDVKKVQEIGNRKQQMLIKVGGLHKRNSIQVIRTFVWVAVVNFELSKLCDSSFVYLYVLSAGGIDDGKKVTYSVCNLI